MYEVACKTKAYVTDVGAVSKLRFHKKWGLVWQIMAVDSSSALSPEGPWECPSLNPVTFKLTTCVIHIIIGAVFVLLFGVCFCFLTPIYL